MRASQGPLNRSGPEFPLDPSGDGGDGTRDRDGTPDPSGLRRFQFLQELAAGGFGSVYLAKMFPPTGPAQVVAIKLLHRRWTDNFEIASRMRDEARLLGQLHHENIVEVLDFAMIDGRSAIVMEVLEAVDVRVILDAARRNHAPVPLGAAASIAAAVARALHAAYNRPPIAGGRPLRVIHRDIKPSNVMVDADGHVKVLDFGVARAEFESREAKTAELAFGSLEYMPPERLFFEPESAASDVYSVGTLLYEMLMLDKLGKAKLRQSEQERFVAERLSDLVERNPWVLGGAPHRGGATEPAIEADAVAILQELLAFDDAKRPEAGDAAARLEQLARRCAPSLAVWAATVVPQLVDESRARHGGGTLVGETLYEDPRSTAGQDLVDPGGLARSGGGAGFRKIDEAIAAEPDPDDGDDGPNTMTALGLSEDIATETLRPEDFVESLPDAVPTVHDPRPSVPAAFESDATRDTTHRDDTSWQILRNRTLEELDHDGGNPTDLRRGRIERTVPTDTTSEWLELEDEVEGAPTIRMDPEHEGHDGETELALVELRPPVVLEPPSEIETVMVAPSQVRSPASSPPPPPPPSAPAPPVVVVQSVGAGPAIYLAGATMLLLASLAILLSVLIVSGVGVFALSSPPRAASAAGAPGPAAEAVAPIELAPMASASVPPGAEGARFRSDLAGTKRMIVRCDDRSAAGIDEVFVAGTGWTECTVTAMDASRHRRTALLDRVEARTYRCFGGVDGTTCE